MMRIRTRIKMRMRMTVSQRYCRVRDWRQNTVDGPFSYRIGMCAGNLLTSCRAKMKRK